MLQPRADPARRARRWRRIGIRVRGRIEHRNEHGGEHRGQAARRRSADAHEREQARADQPEPCRADAQHLVDVRQRTFAELAPAPAAPAAVAQLELDQGSPRERLSPRDRAGSRIVLPEWRRANA